MTFEEYASLIDEHLKDASHFSHLLVSGMDLLGLEDRNITRVFHISRPNVARWVSGKSKPRDALRIPLLEWLQHMARLEDFLERLHEELKSGGQYSDVLIRGMGLFGLSDDDLIYRFHVSRFCVESWQRGEHTPRDSVRLPVLRWLLQKARVEKLRVELGSMKATDVSDKPRWDCPDSSSTG